MTRRILLLAFALLTTAAAIWQSFALWDSYAQPSFQRAWHNHTLTASGNERGRWAREEGPIQIDVQLLDEHSELVYPLTGAFAQYAEEENDPYSPRTVRESAFSEIRIYNAEDESAYTEEISRLIETETNHDTLRAKYDARKMHVYATRYHWFPFHWLPPLLFVLAFLPVFLLTRPFGRFRSAAAYFCLLLATSLVILWCRSYRGPLRYTPDAIARLYLSSQKVISHGIGISKGCALVTSRATWGMPPYINEWDCGFQADQSTQLPPNFAGFAFHQFHIVNVDVGSDGWTLSFPLAIPLALLLLYPALLTRRLLINHKNRNEHLCLTCSYDLRAHRPGEKCPECGTLVLEKKQT